MCQAYEGERDFMTFLEQNGYAFHCKECYRWSYMRPDKCSWCKDKPATSQPAKPPGLLAPSPCLLLSYVQLATDLQVHNPCHPA